ncbi:MAG: hypothetical protein ABI682_11280 [Acidobacteriota bacterium]
MRHETARRVELAGRLLAAGVICAASFAACGQTRGDSAQGAAVPRPQSGVTASANAPERTRRIAVRAAEGVLTAAELDRMAGWAGRQGIEVRTGGEGDPVPAGWETLRVAVAPASAEFSRRLMRFGVRTEANGFLFDGRTYRAPEDAIAVRDPAIPAETLLFANARPAVPRLAGRRLFFREGPESDYLVISGDLVKTGRFSAGAGAGALAILRASDRDEIRAREDLLHSFVTVEREGARWEFPETERAAVERLEPMLAHFPRKAGGLPLVVRIFPDATAKARLTGSSRPADVSLRAGAVHVDVDASAPPQPDLLSPAFAAASEGSGNPKLFSRPTLLLAMGARAAGRWWGRDVPGFAAFAARAGVAPTVEEVMNEAADDVSPILAVGTAAAWVEAGARLEGEPAVRRDLSGADSVVTAALRRWEKAAAGAPVAPPPRRPLPKGFLRGLSYAMSNSLDASYSSPRSRDTLTRLAGLGANAISVMPFSFQREASRPTLAFVHRNPQGETDEGTVRAVTDARVLGITAMVKPQIWVGHEVFVGNIEMGSNGDWVRWFALYRRFLVHHAIVSEASGASLFCVGTELIKTESRVADWREAIASVRLATGAPLTYAANWTAGALRVPFWDALDAIGVDFYDPPSSQPDAADTVLEAGVRRAAVPLAALSSRTGKPVIFTEAGFPLCRAAWMAPHDENTGRPAHDGDAARAISAVYRALEKEPWWKGVYWWKAFSSGRDARPDERGFNVLGGAPQKAVAEGFEWLARERTR